MWLGFSLNFPASIIFQNIIHDFHVKKIIAESVSCMSSLEKESSFMLSFLVLLVIKKIRSQGLVLDTT